MRKGSTDHSDSNEWDKAEADTKQQPAISWVRRKYVPTFCRTKLNITYYNITGGKSL